MNNITILGQLCNLFRRHTKSSPKMVTVAAPLLSIAEFSPAARLSESCLFADNISYIHFMDLNKNVITNAGISENFYTT